MSRENVKLLIESSPDVEAADEIINEFYNFESIDEKTAFLKGMFDIKIVDVHYSKEITYEESQKIKYFSILNIVILG